jgi:hypothetical protein
MDCGGLHVLTAKGLAFVKRSRLPLLRYGIHAHWCVYTHHPSKQHHVTENQCFHSCHGDLALTQAAHELVTLSPKQALPVAVVWLKRPSRQTTSCLRLLPGYPTRRTAGIITMTKNNYSKIFVLVFVLKGFMPVYFVG